MDVKQINIFLESLTGVLGQFGVKDIKKVNLQKKETMNVTMDVTALIGLTGDIKGNVAYAFNRNTGEKLASLLMDMEVIQIDAMARSAIGEVANMITGRAATMFGSIGKTFLLTPPSLIFGTDILFVISSADTIAIDLETSIGPIQVNIGLEM